MWINIFKTNQYGNSPFLILHMFFTVIIIFAVCILIDYIRNICLDKTINTLAFKIERLYLNICNKLKKIQK